MQGHFGFGLIPLTICRGAGGIVLFQALAREFGFTLRALRLFELGARCREFGELCFAAAGGRFLSLAFGLVGHELQTLRFLERPARLLRVARQSGPLGLDLGRRRLQGFLAGAFGLILEFASLFEMDAGLREIGLQSLRAKIRLQCLTGAGEFGHPGNALFGFGLLRGRQWRAGRRHRRRLALIAGLDFEIRRGSGRRHACCRSGRAVAVQAAGKVVHFMAALRQQKSPHRAATAGVAVDDIGLAARKFVGLQT